MAREWQISDFHFHTESWKIGYSFNFFGQDFINRAIEVRKSEMENCELTYLWMFSVELNRDK